MLRKMISLFLVLTMALSAVVVGNFSAAAAELDPGKLYFDVSSTGWNMGAKDKVGFYVFPLGDDVAASYKSWGGKRLQGVNEGNGIWSYDPTNFKLENGVQYKIIFTHVVNSAFTDQTYDLFFDTTCLGHVAYCDGDIYENPADSSKTTQAAYWRAMDPSEYGPVLQISSIGNVIGTCPGQGKTPLDVFADYISVVSNDIGTTGLDNARRYVVANGVKTEQELIDDIGTDLKLTKQEVYDAFTTNKVTTVWNHAVSTLPGDVVPLPTEAPVPTEAPATEAPTEAPHIHTPGAAVRENVVPATCGQDGSYDEVVYCTGCNEELSREIKTIKATGEHTPGDPVRENVVPATYSDNGFYDEVVYCTECGEELSRETVIVPALIPPTEAPTVHIHIPGAAVKENVVPAFYDREGSYDVVYYCTECGEELSRETVIVPALIPPTEAPLPTEAPATEAPTEAPTVSPYEGYYLVGNFTGWSIDRTFRLEPDYNSLREEYVYREWYSGYRRLFKIAYSYDGINAAYWYPSGMGNSYGENGEIADYTQYDIRFRPNYDGGYGWFRGCIYASPLIVPTEAPPEPTVAPYEPTTPSGMGYDYVDSYTVNEYTPYAEDAILACGGSLYDTQTIYFQAPADWANKYNTFYGPDDDEPYMHVCVYWWSGIGSTWPNGNGVKWVGYQAHLVDKENRIYSAMLPAEGTANVVWNNGVNGGMDKSAEIFNYAAQIYDASIEGADPGEYDTLPEGTPDEWNMDGCILIIDYNQEHTNALSSYPLYGFNWYIYYGDGCYGSYARTSDHFYSKYDNCLNPEHHHFIAPTEAPVPTEAPWYPPTECPTEYYCDHYWYGTYTEDTDYRYYNWGYTYDTVTYCANCDTELYRTSHTVKYSDKSRCLNFDNTTTNWVGPIKFYVYPIGGDAPIPWGSKKLNGTDNGDGTWSYDPSEYMDLEPGKQYALIFNDSTTNAQTYELLFDTTCLGDTAYCTGNYIENPYDSNKIALEVKWKNNSSLGPMLRITSIGNVVGETCPANTAPYQMFVDFLQNTLDNARVYPGRSDQRILDDIAVALGLTDSDVQKAISEAHVSVDWKPQHTEPTTAPVTNPPDQYGYVPNAYYLTGTINGDNSGIDKVHKNLLFTQDDIDYTLTDVRLTQGDTVNIAYYRGNNVFLLYPDGIGQEKTIARSGYYTFYFKPYEFGNPNRWYFTPAFTGDIVEGILGDADGDGEIGSADATYIQRWLAKLSVPFTKPELMRGDADGNGELELIDVTLIQYQLAGMRTPYPIGK